MRGSDMKKANVDVVNEGSQLEEALVEKNSNCSDCQFRNVDADEGRQEGSKIMTTKEVATYLKISHYSVYNLVKRKELPAIRVLNKLRFDSRQVEQYLKKQRIDETK